MSDEKEPIIEFRVLGPRGGILFETKHQDTLEETVRWMKKQDLIIGKIIKRTIFEEELQDWK